MNELFVPLNAKGGRPRKFARPSLLLNAFQDYLEDRKQRTIRLEDLESGYIGNSGVNKTKTKVVHHPLSIADFCVFLGCSRQWWGNLPDEFNEVKGIISDYIFTYQLKGAETGAFNANIVARELGLADKKEESVKIVEIPKEFTKEQAKDFIANMNK